MDALSYRNCFARRPIERASHLRQNDEWIAENITDEDSRFVPVWRTKNLIDGETSPHAVFLNPSEAEHLLQTAESIAFLGKRNGKTYYAVGLESDSPSLIDALNRFGQLKDLRAVGALLDVGQGSLLAYSRAITYWHSQHRFCGRCASPTKSTNGGHVLICSNPECGQEHFPRTDPAIIVAVTSQTYCLLGRQPRWRKGVYSTLAGFVEPGESFEAAVAREVKEETGITVNAVHYHSSQPWPFPCSVMIGFIAEAEKASVAIDGAELEDAKWFTREEIAAAVQDKTLLLPGPISIAYRLISHWFDSAGGVSLKELIHAK